MNTIKKPAPIDPTVYKAETRLVDIKHLKLPYILKEDNLLKKQMLKEAIKATNFYPPLLIDPTNRIIDGVARYNACLELNHRFLNCTVIEIDFFQSELWQLTSAILTNNFTKKQLMDKVKFIANRHSFNNEDESYTSSLWNYIKLNIADDDKEYKEAIKNIDQLKLLFD